MSRHGNFATATITNGTALTGALNLDILANVPQDFAVTAQKQGMRLGGIIMPAGWTAANLTFQISADGVSFVNMYDKYGSEVVVAVAAGQGHVLDFADYITLPWLKIRSGTAATPVNQAADRSLTLLLRATGV